MRSKLTTFLLVLGLAAGTGGAAVLAADDDDGGKGADTAQYKPGKGCGDPNRPHSGPPGNPRGKDCPPKSKTPKADAKRRCARKYPRRAKRRSICVKRRTAVARCKATKKGKSRKRCVARANRRAACARKHMNSAKKRTTCVKRSNARARCRTKKGEKREKCMARANKIGKPKSNGKDKGKGKGKSRG